VVAAVLVFSPCIYLACRLTISIVIQKVFLCIWSWPQPECVTTKTILLPPWLLSDWPHHLVPFLITPLCCNDYSFSHNFHNQLLSVSHHDHG
jgi:hypothetical protein